MPQKHAVTGAFGFTGQYIARRLLAAGHQVITLTGARRPNHPLADQVQAYPFDFDNPRRLREHLAGVKVLYNTYWVRFNHQEMFSHYQAVHNTLALFQAACEAGVERIVHVSITNPSATCPLEYFSAKARLEAALQTIGISHAILRPAVLFGRGDILINNIAWGLRRFPVFAIFGDGSYRVQPIYVDDMAQLAVEQGASRRDAVIDAIGPQTFTYRELVQAIGWSIGKPRPLFSVSPRVGYWLAWALGRMHGDVMLTREEIQGLMQGLLYVEGAQPAGQTRLTDWIRQNHRDVGHHYASELARRGRSVVG